MGEVFNALTTVVASAVSYQQRWSVQDANGGVRDSEGQVLAHRLGRNRVVIEIKANVNGFVGTHRLQKLHDERMCRQRKEARFFLEEDLKDGSSFFLGMGTEQSLVSPLECPSIVVGKVRERTTFNKTAPDEADRTFDTTFFIGPPRRTQLRLKMVVCAQLEQSWVETRLWTISLDNSCFEIVIQ